VKKSIKNVKPAREIIERRKNEKSKENGDGFMAKGDEERLLI
jgi:hypothetical protein